MDSVNSPPASLPSYSESQLETLVQRLSLSDKKSPEDNDAFLANLLPFAELELGREVTIEELKQMTEGVLPVELPKNYKKASRYNSEVTKKRPEPQKAQTLPIGSKAPSLGERSDTGQPGQGTAVTSAEDSDPDSEVERAQIALLEAKKKKAERKKARTMDDTLPHQPDTAQASWANHPLHPTGFPYPHAYPHAPWNPARHPAHWQAAPFTMPGSPSPSIMSPAGSEWPGSPASTGSGNFTYNVTSGSYNDNSIRRITKGGRRKTTNRDYDGSN